MRSAGEVAAGLTACSAPHGGAVERAELCDRLDQPLWHTRHTTHITTTPGHSSSYAAQVGMRHDEISKIQDFILFFFSDSFDGVKMKMQRMMLCSNLLFTEVIDCI